MSSIPPNAPCPCGSGAKHKKCCRPYHMGRPALTPEALMRSRYTAYAAGNMQYIMATTHPDGEWYRDDPEKWLTELHTLTKDNEYLGLVIHSAPAPTDDTGEVTFTATITRNGEDLSFSEKSRFKMHNRQWKYLDGDVSSTGE